MEFRFQEARVTKSEKIVHSVELVREGRYIAEIDVQLIETGTGWSPLLSLSDAEKLEDARAALRRGDLDEAAKLGRLYHLTPVPVAAE